MSEKIFPIQNSSACVFKWAWNTFRIYNGKTSSCARVKPTVVSLDQFDNIHNSDEILNDRYLMLQGKWPEGRGCEYCKNVEDAGGVSDRLYHNNIPGLTPKNFDLTQPMERNLVSPSIVEIYLNNTCDLACVYCIPHASSKINNELIKYGSYPIDIKPVKKNANHLQYKELFFNWLKENYSGLIRLSILGGEPLLQKEFWELLSIIEQNKNVELTVSINTNLNCHPDTLKRFVSVSKNLLVNRRVKHIDIAASLDCWGGQAEFVRYGLKLTQWQENFEYLMNFKWLRLSVHQVISSLTIGTASQLQEKIANYKKINPKIQQSYHLVDAPNDKIYHPIIFGNEFFNKQLLDLLDQFPISTEWDEINKLRLDGIVKYCINGRHNEERLMLLKQTLDEIDIRRKTDWKNLFPSINRYFLDYNIK